MQRRQNALSCTIVCQNALPCAKACQNALSYSKECQNDLSCSKACQNALSCFNPNKSELWEMLELQGVVEADTTLIGYHRSHTNNISSLSHYMSHFIFLEDISIVFSTWRCMRHEKLGFEKTASIAPFACFHPFWASLCSKILDMPPGNLQKSW